VCAVSAPTRPGLGSTNTGMTTSVDEHSAFSVSFDDIEQAARRLEGHVHRTELMQSHALDAAVGATVFSKAEHLQRTGSFKIRGALNRLMQLTDAEKAAGVVAFSSGNHAQGVALAGRILGISTTIVMPIDAPEVKKTATRGYGATVVEYDRYSEDREVVAARVAGDRGCPIVPPFNDPRVIAGQGTVGLESAQDGPRFDIAVLPVGGGGLTSGMAIALKAMNPGIRLWGVEPAAADDARQSLAAGHIVTIEQPRTVADGVATQAVGLHTFPILQSLLEGIVTVTEDEILSALGFVMTRMKQAVEPTGALTTAALMCGRIPDASGAQVLSVFCGGNLDLNVIGQIPR
jgi:threo-3-hydroxy-L-aspartate ammonia-lyase